MSEDDHRIDLWRNTIQLFHQSNRSHFIGPFKAAGFNKYIGEPYFISSESGNPLTPDIVASSDDGWLVLELTTRPGSKESQLESYKSIDPQDLKNYGLHENFGNPDVIISRLSFIPDGPYCKISVKDHLEIQNEEYINNPLLKEELMKSNGADLRRLPSIPITLLPEMKPQEIRKGLISLVMQIFEPGSEGKTLVQLVDGGLERLQVRPAARSQLIDKVKTEMTVLIKDFLSEYLIFENNHYNATDKFKYHYATLSHITQELNKWAGITPQQTLDVEYENEE